MKVTVADCLELNAFENAEVLMVLTEFPIVTFFIFVHK